MPPIFGILNTRLQQPDQEMTGRMKGAAHYVKPRRIIESGGRGFFMAAAVAVENPLVRGEDTMAVSGEWCIVADACLYKREELLGKIGRGGEGGSDAALILEAYLKWGEQCVQHLYGDFAFVIFNTETGEVFCGRDPLGVRPLFYAFTGQEFIFASELRYVIAAFPHKPPIREEYLLDTLITAKTEKGKAPFEKTFRLKPGHYLRHTIDSSEESPYWSADLNKKIRFDREEDYIQLFREKLVQAVTCRCEGIAYLGAELSGGLDSSTICGIAASFGLCDTVSFTAFSNVYPQGKETEFKDERVYIAAMTAFRPINRVEVDRLLMPIPELLKHSLDIQGCFIQQNYSIFNQGIFEAAGEKEVKVLLSGFGGDELVSSRVALPWSELINEQQWQVIRDELFFKEFTLKSILKPAWLVAKYLASHFHRPLYKTGVFTEELLDKRYASLPLQLDFSQNFRLRQRLSDKYKKPWLERLNLRQYARLLLDHLPQRIEYCYTAAAQYGIEYRYPLLDIDLVETSLAFPPWMKQHHGINRYVFRQAMSTFCTGDHLAAG